MFSEVVKNISWSEISDKVTVCSAGDVQRVLGLVRNGEHLLTEDFAALLSPAAADFLEEMAVLSQQITQKRFGKTIQFYIPLYLSNECTNHCVYCGFNHNNKILRKTLTDEEILKEARVLKEMGYEHILLLTGESPIHAGVDYIENAMRLLQPHFAQISLEVLPLSAEEYLRLRGIGLHAVYVYQETYCHENYTAYHPAGRKRDYEWRVNTQDRLGLAEVHKIGLGALLGLEDPRAEAMFMATHLRYLQKKYWKSKYAVAFPRMRPFAEAGCGGASTGFTPKFIIDDKLFVQLILAFRLFDPDIEISLTTRESPAFRNAMLALGVTSVSAGSHTEPGGYSEQNGELPQFSTNDNRSVSEMRDAVNSLGYEAVMRDWTKFA
ncbi:MAG: 2-iminoacetate synthase ThiH [Bacteroidales bacterium]|jgi:2-iminoacetate synthase|nr:2-iminoacetate synthase ThiH [Bacteroidales bacterium]